MSKKIAMIGKCMIELSKKGTDIKHSFSSNTLNTSIYITHQVNPAALTIHYITALGTDSFSQQMLDTWHSKNIDTSLTQQMENHLPGLYYIETNSTSKHTFYYWQNKATTKFWLESEQSTAICKELANFNYLYLSRISLAILSPTSHEKLLSLLHKCHANSRKVIFNNNYHPRLWASKEETQQVYQQMLECTDITFLTLDNKDTLWGQQPVEDIIAHTHNTGMKEVVVKHRADSCLVSIAGKGLVDVPAAKLPKEKVINTTTAGNSFSASYLAVHLTGSSAENTAKHGHLTTSTIIQYHSTIIPHEAMPA